MLIIIVNITIMKFSDFFSQFSPDPDWTNDEERQKLKDEIHRKEMESNISKGLVPYIKRKGIFISCLNSNGSMDRNRYLASISNIKWLNPKIIEKVNQTLTEAKTLKKEYRLKKKADLEEFKIRRSETKTNYRGEIDILESAAKRIIKTGHPYLI